MAKKRLWFGVLVMILVFAVASIACAQSSGGTFTLTGIPSRYDGMYAMLEGWDGNTQFLGLERIIDYASWNVRLSRISDGKVILPMWIERPFGSSNFERYSGNHGDVGVLVIIARDPDGENDVNGLDFGFIENRPGARRNVNFSGGSATRSWNDGVAWR